MDIVQAVLPALLRGAGVTLQTAAQAGLLALVISVIVGALREVGFGFVYETVSIPTQLRNLILIVLTGLGERSKSLDCDVRFDPR